MVHLIAAIAILQQVFAPGAITIQVSDPQDDQIIADCAANQPVHLWWGEVRPMREVHVYHTSNTSARFPCWVVYAAWATDSDSCSVTDEFGSDLAPWDK